MIGPAQARRTRSLGVARRVSIIVGALGELVLDPVQLPPFVLDLTALASRHDIQPFTNGEVVKAMEEARTAGWTAWRESDRGEEPYDRIMLKEPENMAAQAHKEGIRL